jgi:uncharacterized protein with HEPN domain
MQLESKKFLADMLEAVTCVRTFAHGRALSDLTQDKMLRSATYWQFTIIGEALSQLRKEDEATFDRITESWRIVGFRNQIIHGYQVIEDNVTWQIIQDKLPILQRELEQLPKE